MDTTARERLETWLRARCAHLDGLVLDVGGGPGERKWIPSRVTLDASPARGPDLVGDIEDLEGIPDGGFGSIVCTEVLEHVAHPDRALAELRRVTASGGALLLSSPWFYPFHPAPVDLRRFTLQGMVRAVEEAGWTVREAEGIPLDAAAHAHLVEAVRIMTGGRCPMPESLAWSNWVVRAEA